MPPGVYGGPAFEHWVRTGALLPIAGATEPTIASQSVDKEGNTMTDIIFTPATDGPSGIVDGDLLVAFVAHSATSTADTITAPEGWSTAQQSNGELAVFYRIASSEPLTYTFSSARNDATIGMTARMWRVTGHDATTPIVVTDSANLIGATTNGRPVHVGVNLADSLVVQVISAQDDAVRTFTPPDGYTEQFDGCQSDPGTASSLGAATKVMKAPVPAEFPLFDVASNAYYVASGTSDWLTCIGFAIRPSAPSSSAIPRVVDAQWGSATMDVGVTVDVFSEDSGDLLVAYVAATSDASAGPPSIATPAGWTLQATSTGVRANGREVQERVFTKAVTGAEAAVSFTATPSDSACPIWAYVAVVRNPNAGFLAVEAVSASTGDSTALTYTVLGVTTIGTDCLVLYGMATADALPRSFTAPVDVSEFLDATRDDGTAVGFTMACKVQVAAGPTGSQVFTLSSGADSLAGACIAIRPGAELLGASTMSGVGTLSATTNQVLTASATMAGVGTLAATSNQVLTASATMSGVGTLSTVVTGVLQPAAAFSGVGTLSAAATLVLQPAATFSGVGTLEAVPTLVVEPTATFSGVGTMSAISTIEHRPGATFSGVGTMSAVATLFAPPSALPAPGAREAFPDGVVQVAWGNDPFDTPDNASDWTDISTKVRELTTDRGRAHESEQFQSGTAILRCDNRDRRFDPNHSAGPYYPNVKALRRVRILARHADLDRTGLSLTGDPNSLAIRNPFTGFPSSALSFEAWVYFTDSSKEGTVISYAVAGSLEEFVVILRQGTTIRISIDASAVDTGITLPVSEAVHVAVVWRSSDGLLRLYLNGALRYETTHKQGATLTDGGALVVGQEQDVLGTGFQAAEAFVGRLRELRLWNVARTQHAVHKDMFRSLTGSESGLVAYWKLDEGTGGTSEDDTAGTNDLTVFGGSWIAFPGDRPIYTGFIETIEPVYKLGDKDAEVIIRCADAQKSLAKLREPDSPYRNVILDQAPYLCWPLDETGKTALDISGNARNGTYIGAVAQGVDVEYPVAEDGRGVRIDAGSYVEAASGVAWFERTQPFSGSIILRYLGEPYLSINTQVRICGAITPPPIPGNTEHRGWRWELRSFGHAVNINNHEGSLNFIKAEGHVDVLDGHWHHLAFTYDGSATNAGFKLYVDGERISSVHSGGISATSIGTGLFRLGVADTAPDYVCEAKYMTLFTTALTATQIRDQYLAAFEAWEAERADERAANLLDLIDFPSQERDLRRAVATAGGIFDLLGNPNEELQQLAEMEVSGTYITEDGLVAFDDRYANVYDSEVLYTFDDTVPGESYTDVGFIFDDFDIATRVIATRTPDGQPIILGDASAQDSFTPRTIPVSGPWSDDYQARAVGQKILDRLKTSKERIEQLGLSANVSTWRRVFEPRLHRDRVRVKRTPPGGGTAFERDYFVEAITHRATPKSWRTVFGLVPADTARSDLFVVGRSALDGTGKLTE